MERATRLRRYLRKDYTQLVEFPVEIVGRDGLVRRYSFDDSVRLYHRRIHSAPMRYDDGDLVDAEVRHCRQRIEQLRRSYLEHFGWGTLRDGQIGGLFGGPLAAEVAAFLHRAFAAEREGPRSLRVTLIHSGVGDTFYLRCVETSRAWMLYAWRLDADGPAGARDAWQSTVARLAAAPVGDGVERLLYTAEGPDVALALAGTGEWLGPAGDAGPDGLDGESPDPLHAGLRALYDGHPADALGILEAGLDAGPARLGLAQATALVALLEGEAERAEFAARFGRLHRPADPLLTYLLGVAVARAGRLDEARALAEEGAAIAPRSPLAPLLAGVLALRSGRLLTAWRALGSACVAGRDARYVVRAARTVRSWMTRWAVATLAGAGAIAGGVALVAVGAPMAGVAVIAAGIVGISLAAVRLARAAVALAAGEKRTGVPRLVSLELLPRDRELDGHH